jgi:hypothetical protein
MKFTVLQKVIVGGLTAAVIIVGGSYIKAQHDEAEAKKAAEIAYANRPILDKECVMNGYGKGSCDFTNVGKSAGSMCGKIEVQGPGNVQSNVFCSGQVQPMSTEKVEFNIPTVDELCDNGFGDWRDKCEFSFIESGLGGGKTTES